MDLRRPFVQLRRWPRVQLAATMTALALVLSVGAVAWAQSDPAATPVPTARCCGTLAYDGQHVILYGGATSDADLGDTWSFDGTSWTQLTLTTSPGVLYDSAMAYDSATSTVVLFGGRGADSQYVAGTWLWNGTSWSLATPTTAPPPRANANLAYDAATGTVVLWGGCCDAVTNTLFTDTWTWNGSTWQQRSPVTVPPGSESAAMAYDSATGTVLLLDPSATGTSTWSWDGTTWTQQTGGTNPAVGGALSYDSTTQTLVLFGVDGTTWTWTAAGWVEQSPATVPAARTQATLADNPGGHDVVLFGGSADGTPQSDTWTWDGTTWTSSNLLATPTPAGG